MEITKFIRTYSRQYDIIKVTVKVRDTVVRTLN